MTKFKSITLSLLLASTFIACSSSENPTSTQDATLESTTQPVAETPVAETPVAETPVAETPVAETPVAETPVANGHTVFATGETRSFMPNDDGATQRGVEKSYTKSGGIVTDTITSLQWQDNVSSQRANWSDAVAYCSNLTIEGTAGWRLPSMHELTTLVDLGYEPKIDPLFSTKRSGKFWSSTEYAFDTSKYAYYSDFSTGFSADYGDRSVFEKSNSYAVRCVKGDAIKEGEFKKDTAKELVSDSTANLMWEDTSHINRTSGVGCYRLL